MRRVNYNVGPVGALLLLPFLLIAFAVWLVVSIIVGLAIILGRVIEFLALFIDDLRWRFRQ